MQREDPFQRNSMIEAIPIFSFATSTTKIQCKIFQIFEADLVRVISLELLTRTEAKNCG